MLVSPFKFVFICNLLIHSAGPLNHLCEAHLDVLGVFAGQPVDRSRELRNTARKCDPE